MVELKSTSPASLLKGNLPHSEIKMDPGLPEILQRLQSVPEPGANEKLDRDIASIASMAHSYRLRLREF